MTPLSDWLKNTRLCAGGLFLLTLLLFYTAIGFDFLTYDDGRYVTQEKHVKQGLNAETIGWAFSGPHHSMWHPLTSLSHLLDVQLFGMNPGAHHMVNVVIHALNAVVLYYLLILLFNTPVRALMVAAIFAWHPLRVESVAWVSERKDVLCTLFWLLTLHAYTRYIRQPGKGRYAMLLVVFALGVMSKPMIVTLPAVLLLLDGWPFKRLGISDNEAGGLSFDWGIIRQRLVEKLPLFGMSLFLAAITYKAQHEGDVLSMMATTSLAGRVGNALVSYIRYLGLMVWPVDLSVLYPHPGRWPLWVELGALASLAGITFLSWRLRRAQPWWLFAWGWFLITLLPVIGLIQAGGAALANRYTYISTIGLVLAVVWSLAEWVRGAEAERRKPAMIAVFSVVLSCVVLTWSALPFWRNTETLFREAIRVTKSNAVAHLVLGEALLDQGRADEALAEFSRGILITPSDAKLHLLAGQACLEMGLLEQAVQAFQNTQKMDPKLDEAEFQLARAYRRLNRVEEAKQLLGRYLQKHPENASAWNNLGGIQADQRDGAGAEKSFRNALASEPDSLEPRRNLIRLLSVMGQPAAALEQVLEGLKYHQDNADLWYQAGLLQEQAGSITQARAAYEAAVRLAPDWPLPKESLAWVLIQQPQINEADAKQSFALAEEVAIAYGKEVPIRIRELQGCVLAANGRFPEAIAMTEKVRWVSNENKDARAVARLDQQLAAFKAGQRWVPGKK